MDKNSFLGQLPEADKDDLVALADDNIAVVLVEALGEARLTIIPNSDAGFAAACADTFEAEWAVQNP